jgi:hypothetical protein
MKTRLLSLRNLVSLAAINLALTAASALGANLTLAGFKIHLPSGDSAEIGSRRPLPSLEVTINSDDAATGPEWISAYFSGPGGEIYFFGRSEDFQPSTAATAVSSRNYRSAKYLLNRSWDYIYNESEILTGEWRLNTLDIGWGSWEDGTEGFQSYTEDDLRGKGWPVAFQMTGWISEHPVHTVVTPAGRLNLSVTLSGEASGSTTFQWYKNGTAIPGATQRTYQKSSVTEANDAGVYYVVLTNGTRKVQSDAAIVSVRTANNVTARTALNEQRWAAAKTAIGKDASAKSPDSTFVAAMAEICDALGGAATQAVLAKAGMTGSLAFPNLLPALPALFPANTSTTLVNDWMSKTLAPALLKAEAALATLTNPAFVTTVGAGDIGAWNYAAWMLDTTVFDFADVQALRILLNGAIGACKVWESLDTTLRVDLVQSMYNEGKLSVESVLKLSTKLLQNSAVTKAKTDAFAAIQKAVSLYPTFGTFAFGTATATPKRIADDGSHFVEAQVRFDGISRQDHVFFQEWARLIGESIASGLKPFPVELNDQNQVVYRNINLKALQTRGFAVRAMIPSFSKNGVTGTAIGDYTFGGTLPWVTRTESDHAIDWLAMNEPKITAFLGTREDQSPPLLILTDVPVNGKEVLLSSDDTQVVLSGTVQDESEVTTVLMDRTFGGVTETLSGNLEELETVYDPGTGKSIRTWRWSFVLDFPVSGECSLALYGVDEYKQKSVPTPLKFTVSRSVHVLVDIPLVYGQQGGTVTVTPPIPANGLVKTGTKLKITASPKPGFLFRLLEVVVQGTPEDDISRPSVELAITADTVISAQFIADPFPALAGNWNGFLAVGGGFGLLDWNNQLGRVSLTMTKTGNFSLKLVSGRNAFSATGKMDASGVARVTVPENFAPYDGARDILSDRSDSYGGRRGFAGRRQISFSVDQWGGLSYAWDDATASNWPNEKTGWGSSLQKQTSLESFPGLGTQYNLTETSGFCRITISKSGMATVVGRKALAAIDGNIPPNSAGSVGFSCNGPLVTARSEAGDIRPLIQIYAVAAPTEYAIATSFSFEKSDDGFLRARADGYSRGGYAGIEPGIFQIATGGLDPALKARLLKVQNGTDYGLPYTQVSGLYLTGGRFEGISALRPTPFEAEGQAFRVSARFTSIESGVLEWDLGWLRLKGNTLSFEKSLDTASLSAVASTGAFSGNFTVFEAGGKKVRSFTGALATESDDSGIGICTDGTRIRILPY